MNFREQFIKDLRCNTIIKGKKTFKQLATLYGYPQDNGENLCKKDYYKFLEECVSNKNKKTSIEEVIKTTSKDVKSIDNLTLKSQWDVVTKNGIETLRSYTNNVNPNQIQDFRRELIQDIASHSPINNYVFNTTKTVNKDNILVISLPDFHIGRETLSINIVNNYIGVIEQIISEVDMKRVEKIVYVIGNDFFNSDSNYATTKGTPQFDFNTWKETWMFGKNLLLHSIEFLKQFNLPVDVINVPGNHDQNKMFYLADVIEAYFKNDKQVTIDNKSDLFKKYTYGNSLMMFEHGEMRDADYPLIMASEFPTEWGESKFRYIFCGHLHHTIVKEYRGNCFLKFLPSLAKSSSWEESKGYRTTPKAEASVINKYKGLTSTITINI